MHRCLILFVACISVGLCTTYATAAAAAPSLSQSAVSGGLTPLDWAIIFLYAAGVIGLGWHFSRKQTSTKEYFLGSGTMNPALIGISLFATLLSTITYLATPGEVIAKGPTILTSNLLRILPLYLIVGFVIIPVYMRQRVTSAYELLEEKLGLGLRLLGTTMFVLLRLTWMTMLIYFAAKAMVVMLGVDVKWVPLIVLFTGFVAIVYTSLGGLRAVVITDLVQAILLLGGALLVILTVTIHFGDFSWFPTQWQDNWDKQPLFSFNPATRITMIGLTINGMLWFICTAGGDQTAIQRFMATKNAKQARRSFLITLLFGGIVEITLVLVGFALLGYFKANTALLPAGMSVTEGADHLFPRYIAFHLPPGISGLVVAAMFAAAMSSVDSGVNSITAVVTTDYLDRFDMRPKTEAGHVLMARILAFGIGAVVIIGSTFLGKMSGNILEVTVKIGSLFVAPIFALFFFAFFVPFAKPVGVLVGTISGVTTAVLTAFSGAIFGTDPLTGNAPVSFMWITPAALLINILTGTIFSLLIPAKTNTKPV